MKNNNQFYTDQRGVIALSLSIMMPLIIGLLVLGFDVSSYYRAHSRLSESLREASLGANMLENNDQKHQYVDDFIRAYLDDENIKISDIAYRNETINIGSASNRNNTANPSENIDILSYSATLSMPGWFSKFFDPQNEAILRADSSVEPARNDGVGDFLFVMDFTRSMTTPFFGATNQTSFCRSDHENFDPFICQKIRAGNDSATVMQGVVIKIIEMVNAMSENTSEFAFLPSYDGAFQFQKEINSSAGGGSSSAKYFGLQVTFKPQYRLSDYDFWSGVMPRSYAADPFYMTFETPPYKDHPEVNNAWNFFNDIYIPDPHTNVMEFMQNALPKMIDYEATLNDMFDPDKIFSFRFYQDSDLDPSSPQARRNGIVYDAFGSKRNVRERSTRYLGVFEEQDFQKVPNPRTLPVLNISLKDVVNTSIPDIGSISFGILRGAAMLTKGKHKKRTMFVIVDVGRIISVEHLLTDKTQPLGALDARFIYTLQICKRVKDGMRARGVEADVFVINIAEKNESENVQELWRHCAGEDRAAVVENVDEFFDAIKNFILGNELGKFIEK